MTSFTKRILHGGEVISKIRNSDFLNNDDWIEHHVAEGKLNSNALSGGIPNLDTVRMSDGISMGNTRLGNRTTIRKEFTTTPRIPKFIPDPEYNPAGGQDAGQGFSGELNLTKDITLGTYLKGNEHIPTSEIALDDRAEVLKYLYVQAEVLKAARSRYEFRGQNILVDDGLYVYESTEEEVDGDLASLGKVGRAISYKVNDTENHEGNYQLAEYLAKNPWHDKIVLDYHTYGGNFESRVYVILPELDDVYNGTWGRTVETKVNGNLYSRNLVLLKAV